MSDLVPNWRPAHELQRTSGEAGCDVSFSILPMQLANRFLRLFGCSLPISFGGDMSGLALGGHRAGSAKPTADPISLILRAAVVAAHHDDFGLEAGDDIDEIALSGHHVVNVLINAGHLIKPGS